MTPTSSSRSMKVIPLAVPGAGGRRPAGDLKGHRRRLVPAPSSHHSITQGGRRSPSGDRRGRSRGPVVLDDLFPSGSAARAPAWQRAQAPGPACASRRISCAGRQQTELPERLAATETEARPAAPTAIRFSAASIATELGAPRRRATGMVHQHRVRRRGGWRRPRRPPRHIPDRYEPRCPGPSTSLRSRELTMGAGCDDLDAAWAIVVGQNVRRVKPHRLIVQQGANKFGGVVVLEP